MEEITCRVDNQGRVTLPAGWRKAQKLEPGSDVVMTVAGPQLLLQTRERSLDEAQAIVARYSRGKGSAVERLLKERRRQAALEDEEAARHAKGFR
jgi:bifunctional DNA-binding transcriptional regulator/antitoxin component of YhaV-PrlF toxin-antitoxin module